MKLKTALIVGITLLSGAAAHAQVIPNGLHPPVVLAARHTGRIPPMVVQASTFGPNVKSCHPYCTIVSAHQA